MLFAFLLFGCLLLWRDSKKAQREKTTLVAEMEEKNTFYKKEALLAAKEAVQKDIEKFQEETKERRQELSRLEAKLTKKEEMLEDKLQDVATKDAEVKRKMDELLDKEDYLAELVQKQMQELERISGMSSEDAKKLLGV